MWIDVWIISLTSEWRLWDGFLEGFFFIELYGWERDGEGQQETERCELCCIVVQVNRASSMLQNEVSMRIMLWKILDSCQGMKSLHQKVRILQGWHTHKLQHACTHTTEDAHNHMHTQVHQMNGLSCREMPAEATRLWRNGENAFNLDDCLCANPSPSILGVFPPRVFWGECVVVVWWQVYSTWKCLQALTRNASESVFEWVLALCSLTRSTCVCVCICEWVWVGVYLPQMSTTFVPVPLIFVFVFCPSISCIALCIEGILHRSVYH